MVKAWTVAAGEFFRSTAERAERAEIFWFEPPNLCALGALCGEGFQPRFGVTEAVLLDVVGFSSRCIK
jgi:hypothetical protein